MENLKCDNCQKEIKKFTETRDECFIIPFNCLVNHKKGILKNILISCCVKCANELIKNSKDKNYNSAILFK